MDTINRKSKTFTRTWTQLPPETKKYYTKEDLPMLIDIAEDAQQMWAIMERTDVDNGEFDYSFFCGKIFIEVPFLYPRERSVRKKILCWAHWGTGLQAVDNPKITKQILEFLREKGIECSVGQFLSR